MRLKIKSEKIKEFINYPEKSFPKYSSQILNLANSNSQATRPKNVGQMSELIKQFRNSNPHGSLSDWESWYKSRNLSKIKIATNKISQMVKNLKKSIKNITDELIEIWVEDLIIDKTYLGLNFQDSILEFLSQQFNIVYKQSDPTEESQGIDGYLGDYPISIKPISYKQKIVSKQEKIEVDIIYYIKKERSKDIEIEVSENFLNRIRNWNQH